MEPCDRKPGAAHCADCPNRAGCTGIPAEPIAKTFAHHTPTEDALAKIRMVRMGFSDLKSAIEEWCPHSRERSVALTELETAAMWAMKCIVHNDPESVVEP